MGIVKRTVTYPDGRVVEQEVDMTKKTKKRTESKTDVPKRKPEETGKPVRKAYSTTSES